VPDSPPRPNPPDGRPRALLAVMGSMAVQGSVIEWVAATHRSGKGRPLVHHAPVRRTSTQAPPDTAG
jgi:fatty-acid desaturase